MEETVKKDIISLLTGALRTLREPEPNISELKFISNQTIHNASIFQDEHSVSIAILIYSLSKLIERLKDRVDYKKIGNLIEQSIKYLKNNDIEYYDRAIKQIFLIVSKTDDKFKKYIEEVVSQAQIRKGHKIYEHGISASKTAEILGISLWDFYKYLGATQTFETEPKISTVRQRLKFTRSLFS